MDWIKPVKEIFRRFSADKSPLPIVQVNGQKGETGSPFIVKPAASKDRLPGLIVSHIVHDQQENIPPPSIVCFQKNGNNKQSQDAEKLHRRSGLEIFDGTKGQISEEKREKHILSFVTQRICKHQIPRNF